MAANMNLPQQMGMAGQQPQPGQRRGNLPNHLMTLVYQQLVANTPVVVNGWRAGVQMTERMGKTTSL